MLFRVWLVISDLYLFHLIVLLDPVLNCSKSVLSFSVDEVTTGTYNFTSVILNVAFVGLLIAAIASKSASLVALIVNTQCSDYAKIRLISLLINGMSSILQKLLKYLNGTTMSASFSVLLPSNFPVIFAL